MTVDETAAQPPASPDRPLKPKPHRKPRPSRRKPLTWYESDLGPMPDCGACMELLLGPMFIESVYSVAIEHPGDPVDLAKRTVSAYHAAGHSMA